MLDVDLERDDLDARWLVGLGDDRFALIGTSADGRAGDRPRDRRRHRGARTRRARPRWSRQAAGGSTRRSRTPVPPTSTGSARTRSCSGCVRSFDASGSCGTTSLLVLDSATLGRSSLDRPARTARVEGVIGRWDGAPGDDLLVNASAQCPPGGPGQSRLVAVRLRDGTETTVAGLGASRDLTVIPPPLRLGGGDDGPDHALASLTEGLAVVDAAGGEPQRLFDGPTIPLVAGPDAGGVGACGSHRLAISGRPARGTPPPLGRRRLRGQRPNESRSSGAARRPMGPADLRRPRPMSWCTGCRVPGWGPSRTMAVPT